MEKFEKIKELESIRFDDFWDGCEFMAKTLEDRRVCRSEFGDFVLDTCLVVDRDKPYETAVANEHYNPGEWIVLKWFDTLEEALIGHQKLVDFFMKNPNLPAITDAWDKITYHRDRENSEI